MNKKRITFYLSTNLHEEFKNFCEKRGIVMSKKIGMLIEEEIKNEKR